MLAIHSHHLANQKPQLADTFSQINCCQVHSNCEVNRTITETGNTELIRALQYLFITSYVFIFLLINVITYHRFSSCRAKLRVTEGPL